MERHPTCGIPERSHVSARVTPNAGVWDLGFLDSLVLLRYYNASDRESSTMYMGFLGGFTPRYFLMKNMPLGLSLNYYYQRQWTREGQISVDSTDSGFLGLVLINYYVRLGHSFFWKPGLGLGGFYGTHSVPTDDEGHVMQSSSYGGAVRFELGFVFYAGKHMNLRAGPDVLMKFGTDQPAGDEGRSFLSFDAGLSVGLGYSF